MFFNRFTFRSFRFLDPLIFISFQGAAAAAAGRGSPPPPGAGRASVVGFLLFLENDVEKARRGRGLGPAQLPAPPPPVRFLETYGENGGSVGCGNEALAVVWAWFS